MKTFIGKLSTAATLAAGIGIFVLAAHVSCWILLAYPLVGALFCWRCFSEPHPYYSRGEMSSDFVVIGIGWAFLAGAALLLEWRLPDRELTATKLIRGMFV